MPTINVTTRDGSTHVLDGRTGQSLMQNLRDGGIDEILALCGGCASCATCHVYVDEHWLGQLPAMGADEDDLLDCSDARRANSRLSCQIPFTPELHDIAVTVAPEERPNNETAGAQTDLLSGPASQAIGRRRMRRRYRRLSPYVRHDERRRATCPSRTRLLLPSLWLSRVSRTCLDMRRRL